MTFDMGNQATLTAEGLDPRLNPDRGEQNDPPGKYPNKEILETNRDLTSRMTPPESPTGTASPHTRTTGTRTMPCP